MRHTITRLLVVLCTAVPVTQQAAAKPLPRHWLTETRTDPMTDDRIFVAATPAIGTHGALILSCLDGDVMMAIGQLYIPLHEQVQLRYRIGKKTPATIFATASDVLMLKRPGPLLNQAKNQTSIVFEWSPAGVGRQLLTFNITGIDAVVKEVRSNCLMTR